jgi:hypothetical protein
MPGSRQSRPHWKAALLLLALTFAGTSARAVEPDPINLRFEVFGGPGLHFLTLRVRVDEAGGRYAIAVEAETRSLADLFVDLRSRLEVRGRVSTGALWPEAMRAETHRRGVDLNTRIEYDADGPILAEATPPPIGPVTAVTPAQMRGTVDQLTAYLALAHSIARRAPAHYPSVFDGRRRYDLSFTDLATETLPDFASPTQVCRMSRQRIAGFPVDRAGKNAADQGKLWFARLVPGDLAIPVRMEFDSEFGTFTADLAELRGRGVDLRFTE